MSKHSLERRRLTELVAEADRRGVGDQVPEVMRKFTSGHEFNGGAIAWARANPDDPNFYGCCEGAAYKDGEYCTCWVPVYDLDQQPIVAPADGEMQPRPTMCGDCAYRPGSPELEDPLLADSLRELPAKGGMFFCHDNMRRPVRWEHPDGRTIAGSPADYHPPFDSYGRPYRADGRVAAICAGWAACSRRIQNEADKAERTAAL